MEKTLQICGKDVRFRASAALPFLYASHLGSDIFTDMAAIGDNQALNTLTMYRVIWTMAKCADPSIPALYEWLDSFPGMAVYSIYHELNDIFSSSFKGVALKN